MCAVALRQGASPGRAPTRVALREASGPPGSRDRLRRISSRNEEYRHDGHSDAGAGLRLLRPRDRLHLRLRTAVMELTMTFDYSLAGAVSLGLLIYLTYALVRPERF